MFNIIIVNLVHYLVRLPLRYIVGFFDGNSYTPGKIALLFVICSFTWTFLYGGLHKIESYFNIGQPSRDQLLAMISQQQAAIDRITEINNKKDALIKQIQETNRADILALKKLYADKQSTIKKVSKINSKKNKAIAHINESKISSREKEIEISKQQITSIWMTYCSLTSWESQKCQKYAT